MYFAFQLILSNWEGLTPPSDENQIPISQFKKKNNFATKWFFSDVPSVIEMFFLRNNCFIFDAIVIKRPFSGLEFSRRCSEKT